MSLRIGSVPDPLNWDLWDEAKALLEPAQRRGGFAETIEPDEALWAVMDGDELLACATAWLGDGFVEVKLVGGRDYPRWLQPLDEVIGQAARDAGATRLIAFGRRGWVKILRANGWASQDLGGGDTAYSRQLG